MFIVFKVIAIHSRKFLTYIEFKPIILLLAGAIAQLGALAWHARGRRSDPA